MSQRVEPRPLESRQALIVGCFLLGYGTLRTAMALPDPQLWLNIEKSFSLYLEKKHWLIPGVRLVVGVAALLAGALLILGARRARQLRARGFDHRNGLLRSLTHLRDQLKLAESATETIGRAQARTLADAIEDTLVPAIGSAALLVAGNRRGLEVHASLAEAEHHLRRAWSGALDRHGEEMITCIVQAEKNVERAEKVLASMNERD